MEGFNFLLSAALCYGPLALIILGFIAYATLTDAHARRTYLRRLDMRPEAQRHPAYTPVSAVPADTTVATPSGARVTRVKTAAAPPPAPATRTTTVVMPPPPAAAAPARTVVTPPPAPAAPVATGPDNLTKIEGIGPKINSVLQAAGVRTFAQLAQMTPDAIQTILNDAGITRLADPTTWPTQAALAARGDWAALSAMQDDMKGGRVA